MKIKEILKPFVEILEKYLNNFGEDISDDDCFYVMIDDNYYQVDMRDSYWYEEDDGTVVFRINDY